MRRRHPKNPARLWVLSRSVGRVGPQGRNPTLGNVGLRHATYMPPGGRTDLSRLRERTGHGATVFMFRGGETRHDRFIWHLPGAGGAKCLIPVAALFGVGADRTCQTLQDRLRAPAAWTAADVAGLAPFVLMRG